MSKLPDIPSRDVGSAWTASVMTEAFAPAALIASSAHIASPKKSKVSPARGADEESERGRGVNSFVRGLRLGWGWGGNLDIFGCKAEEKEVGGGMGGDLGIWLCKGEKKGGGGDARPALRTDR